MARLSRVELKDAGFFVKCRKD